MDKRKYLQNGIAFLSGFISEWIITMYREGYSLSLYTAAYCCLVGTFWGLLAIFVSNLMPKDAAWLVSLVYTFTTLVIKIG